MSQCPRLPGEACIKRPARLSASRTVTHNLGFAEPPPAAPILEDAMTELGEAVLDD